MHRELAEHELWLESEFSRGQAWVDLMMLANHKTGYIRVRGVRVEIGRGQLGWSAAKLASRWRWSRGRVLRFLNELETVQQIEQQNGQPITVITICNYERYQGQESGRDTADSTTNSTTNGQQIEQQTVQQTVQQTDTNKNVKNKKNEKEVKNSAAKKIKLPEIIDPEKWEAYVRSRRSVKKHPMTDDALQLAANSIVKTVEAGFSIDDCMEAMIESGWRTLKIIYMQNREQRTSASPQGQGGVDAQVERLVQNRENRMRVVNYE